MSDTTTSPGIAEIDEVGRDVGMEVAAAAATAIATAVANATNVESGALYTINTETKYSEGGKIGAVLFVFLPVVMLLTILIGQSPGYYSSLFGMSHGAVLFFFCLCIGHLASIAMMLAGRQTTGTIELKRGK